MYLAIITAFAAVFSTIGQLNGLESVYMESNTEQHSIPEFLYKIISPEQWEESLHVNYVALSSADEDFIHLATEEQVPNIIRKYWNNKDYIILTLDSSKLIGNIVYEANPGGVTLYYHLYNGFIPLDAVENVATYTQEP